MEVLAPMIPYKALHGTLERAIVSDARIDRQIDQLIEQNPRIIPVTDRPSRLGDELVLDYAGFSDGAQFEGGTAQNQTLTLGSGSFIPGFEEQLVGKNVGDAVDVHVTFPAQYHAPNLAGKDAVFKCMIHEIRLKQKYEPDDAFARDVAGLDSLEALRERMREGLQAYLDRQAADDLKVRLLDQLLEDFEIPQDALDRAIDQQLQSLEVQLARQGLTLDAYCRFMGKTREQLREDCAPDARRGIQRQRVIREIAGAEGIAADEDDVARAIQAICRENNVSVEQLSGHLDEAAQSAIVQNIITEKVLARILECAVIDTVETEDIVD